MLYLCLTRCVSLKNRSLVYLLRRTPNHRSCDRIETQRSAVSHYQLAAVMERRWTERTSGGIDG